MYSVFNHDWIFLHALDIDNYTILITIPIAGSYIELSGPIHCDTLMSISDISSEEFSTGLHNYMELITNFCLPVLDTNRANE